MEILPVYVTNVPKHVLNMERWKNYLVMSSRVTET